MGYDTEVLRLSIVTEQLITVEEYARMPEPRDGTRDELIAGKLVYRPLPTFIHDEVCGNAGFALSQYKTAVNRGRVSIGSGFVVERNPDTVIGVDASYFIDKSFECTPNGWPVVPPNAIFEIIDKNEPPDYTMKKIELFRKFGVRIIWLVDPWSKTVQEFRRGITRILDAESTLDGGEVLPGFTCTVTDIFE